MDPERGMIWKVSALFNFPPVVLCLSLFEVVLSVVGGESEANQASYRGGKLEFDEVDQ